MSNWLASTTKQQQHSMSVQKHSNSIHNLFLFLSLFFLFTPIHSHDTTNATTIDTIDTLDTLTDTIIIAQINELIKDGGIERGKSCSDMGLNNCTYIETSRSSPDSDSDPYADINDCNSTKVCIITCDEQYSCSDWHIYATPGMILVIDCIAPGSCKQLSIHATQASFVHLQANNINSITNSQIQCPQSQSHSQSCFICGRCTDMHGDEHCEPTETALSRIFDDDYPVKPSDAMMKHLSIYAEHGYSDVALLCDLSEVSLCVTHSVILCEQQQTCWIAVEYTYDLRSAQYTYVCEDDVQCHAHSYNTTDAIHPTVANVTDGTGSSEDPFAANIPDSQGKDIVTLLRLLRDILMKKNMILYVSITVASVVCLCCVFCVLVCKCSSRDRERENDAKREFKFVQKQQEKQNVKYHKNSYKLCKKCTAKSCLCYYLSCCCCCNCWQCLRRSAQTNTHLNNNHNHNHSTPPKHMHVSKDNVNNNSHTDEPQTINPLSIDKKGGIIPSFFVKNRDKQFISPSHSGTNLSNTVELVVIANNNLHPPAYLSHIPQQSHTTAIAPSFNNNLHKLQQQQSLSSQHGNTERGTFSRSFETQMHLQQRSCSHTSHHDGLEEQAAKKIGDAKLGTNTGHCPHANSNTPASINTPNHNHTPFLPNDACAVTAKHDTDTGTLGGDFAYALQQQILVQQQQIFDAVLVNNTPTTTMGHTPPTNGDTPYTITVGNVPPEAQHVQTQTQTAADGDIINLGGGFAIGPEESTSSTHTSITDSRSSQTFDPEHPSCYDQ